MWDELVRDLARFPDAVLTGLDALGRPTSVRAVPRPDAADRVVRFARPPGVELVDGPASVLCHSHDAQLWNLRSFVARGTVAAVGDDWVFTPTALVPGTGLSGPLGGLRSFVAARGRAGRYLARRGLSRPVVPWSRFRQLR
jgi:hypothetical protein